MIQKLFFPPSGDKQTILSAQYASTFVNLKYTRNYNSTFSKGETFPMMADK